MINKRKIQHKFIFSDKNHLKGKKSYFLKKIRFKERIKKITFLFFKVNNKNNDIQK